MTRRRDTPSPEELLAAWADDPAALAPAEADAVARLVERSPEARRDADDARALLARVRALPDAEPAPDLLDQLGRDIRRAVDDAEARARRSWWRRLWRPALGLGALAAAAAALVWATRTDELGPAGRDAGAVAIPAPADAAPADERPDLVADVADDPGAPLPLGAEGALAADDLDDAVLDEVRAALVEDDAADEDDGAAAPDDPLDPLADDAVAIPEFGLVPDLSLDWVDDLDDGELDEISRWVDDAG